MDLNTENGFIALIEKIIAEDDNRKIYNMFKQILLTAVGTRSEDGKRFIRNPALKEEFKHSEAFSELIIELLGDAESAAEFVTKLVPAGLSDGLPEMASPTLPPEVVPHIVTDDELLSMDRDELKSGLATGKYVLGDK